MLYQVVGIIHLILFIIAAVEILGGGKSLGMKVVWLLVIFVFPFIGLIAYYVAGRGN